MDIRVPQLAEGTESGTVVNVLVAVGDQVEKDQNIIELETAKAVGSVPTTAAGRVEAIHVKVGEEVKVGQRILTIASDGAGHGGQAKPAAPPAQNPSPSDPPRDPQPASPGAPSQPQATPPPQAPVTPPGLPPAAAPSVRRIAEDIGIDLGRVRGTEAGGRIGLQDLKAYVQDLQRLALAGTATPPAPAKPKDAIDFSKWGPVVKKPASPLRRTISRKMTEAWLAVPRVTQFDEADITDLNALRQRHAPAYRAAGAHLTLTGFAIKAVTELLRRHPLFNASMDEEAREIVFKEYIHVGVAVDTEAGLIVPVLRDADKKTMLELSRELDTLAERTRQRKVEADELQGGSFTISNQGGIGSRHFTPIVNHPQAAILGIGRALEKPVALKGKVALRLMLPITVSYDHRMIDGADAARFMVDLVARFEQFEERPVTEGLPPASGGSATRPSGKKKTP